MFSTIYWYFTDPHELRLFCIFSVSIVLGLIGFHVYDHFLMPLIRAFMNKTISKTRHYPTRHLQKKNFLIDLDYGDIPKVSPLESKSLIEKMEFPQYLHQYAAYQHNLRGQIFRETFGGSHELLFIADIDAIHNIHKASGEFPGHVVPEQWTEYLRAKNVERGVFFMDGAEWKKHRAILNRKLTNQKVVKPHFEDMNDATVAFLQEILQRQESFRLKSDLMGCLYQWALDCIFLISFGERIGKGSSNKEFGGGFSKFAASVHRIFELTTQLTAISPDINVQKQSETWTAFCNTCDYALRAAADYIKPAIEKTRKEGKVAKTFLVQELVHEESMSDEMIIRLVTDLILAAGDTTVSSALWVLFALGRDNFYQDKTRRLIQDLKKKMDAPGLTIESHHLPTLIPIRDLLKETMRMFPTAPFITRKLASDTKLLGYNVPAGTMIVVSLYSIGSDEKYFPNPSKFYPQRWGFKNVGTNRPDNSSTLSNLPWGIGVRNCIGRSLAEIQLTILVAHLVDTYELVLKNPNAIHYKMKMIGMPSEDLDLELTKLD